MLLNELIDNSLIILVFKLDILHYPLPLTDQKLTKSFLQITEGNIDARVGNVLFKI